MEQKCQKIALDSCVVINLLEKKNLAASLRAKLRGKHARIILCDVVLDEVYRVRGFTTEYVTSMIPKLIGKKVIRSFTDDSHRSLADSITSQYHICHKGDNVILTLCRAKNFILLTFDRMLLKTCEFVGVAAFHPSEAGGI